MRSVIEESQKIRFGSRFQCTDDDDHALYLIVLLLSLLDTWHTDNHVSRTIIIMDMINVCVAIFSLKIGTVSRHFCIVFIQSFHSCAYLVRPSFPFFLFSSFLFLNGERLCERCCPSLITLCVAEKKVWFWAAFKCLVWHGLFYKHVILVI